MNRVRRASALRKVATATAIAMIAALGSAADPAGDHVIDLPTALRLAGAESVDVQLARERLVEAEADYEAALLRFFPWINASAGYRHHDGDIQDVAGDILTTDKQSYAGGLRLAAAVELGDAWYRRLAAKQMQSAALHAAEAERQRAVLRAARAWFDLSRSQAEVDVAREAIGIADDYARQLEHAVAVGYAHKTEQLRVQVQAEGYRTGLRGAQEAHRLASAQLATILRLDPAVVLVTPGAAPAPLALGEVDRDVQALVGRALSQRAEIKQTQAMTAAALEEHAAAKYGPLIPKVEAHAHWGGLAGGRDGDAGNLGYTSEYLVGLSWRVGPGGLFDRSRVDKEQSRLQQRTLREAGVRDEIARQVVDAATRTQSRADQLRSAERTLELAELTVGLSRERREYGIAAVVEFIESEQDLTRARSRLLEIIAEYNKAQYDLVGAIGELR